MWWGAVVVICLERDADLHMAQLMPLPLTVFCFSEIQINFTFMIPAHLGSLDKRPLNVVCVHVCMRACVFVCVCLCYSVIQKRVLVTFLKHSCMHLC